MADWDAPTEHVEQPKGNRYAVGELIGDKYRLVRRLGEGGMASVWVAHDEALDIDVAIKFIRAELQNAGLTSRLLQEARAAAQLKHPAIVRVTDFGNPRAGDPYIVMELLCGEDLAATIKRRGPMQALRAVRTLLPIADALAAAHAKRIVHRDLKPENVYLAQTEEGRTQPKLVDFGIAKLEVEDSQRITQLGATMGSPAYMSPEQARGLDVDPRTDVWAFCVVLYETLTGLLPFNGPNYTALLCSILESQPKPITELGVGDAELWNVIARGLEKDPARRTTHIREVGAALARWALARGAADDVSGASLTSSWVERPPDSVRPSLPSSAFSTAVPQTSSPSGASMGSTQLDATLAGATKPRGRSTLLFAIGGFAVASVILVTLGLRLFGASEKATGTSTPLPERSHAAVREISPDVPRPPVEPPASAEPAASASTVEPAPVASAAPVPTNKRPAATAKPTLAKPPAAPPAAPSVKPTSKPPEKPPELDIKTNL